jgi:hypothetical protein
MKIEVSNGELVDKIIILEIKNKYITDKNKLKNILKELSELKKEFLKIDFFCKKDNLYISLYDVNEKLWQVEDKIREKDNLGEFNEEFIKLAKSVYELNDKRALIKKEINIVTNSIIVEEKSYKNL